MFCISNGVIAIKDSGSGLTVELNRGAIDTDMVLMSVGVRPDTAFVKNSGVDTDGRGSIKGRPVYVHCHSGLRSYIACRILKGFGFECYNLAGGWRLYESVINEKTVPEYICTECK